MNAVTSNRPAHSPLGASGAERWMNCAGSVALIKSLTLPESDEPDYRITGTAAHALGAHLLAHPQIEAWELIGEKFEGMEVDAEMANAVTVYVDTMRPLIAKAKAGTQVMIEYPISSPIHKDFYGTVDCGLIVEEDGLTILDITDYKHGEGIVVEVENNPQLKYYAFGVLQNHEGIDRVRLRIVQPRIEWHPDGVVREWTCSADSLTEWVESELVPAMNRTEVDHDLDAGPWCRFCPAKLVCPLMTSLFGAAAKCDPAHIVNLNDASLARSYQYTQAVKFYLKALEEHAFSRLNSGAQIDGLKLVNKKANRVLRPGAEDELLLEIGDEIYSKPALKSPAELEKISPAAKKLVRQLAYTPQTGLTVALASDDRPAVKVQSTQEAFGAAVANIAAEDPLAIPGFLKR